VNDPRAGLRRDWAFLVAVFLVAAGALAAIGLAILALVRHTF
jgi:hypothetical protein